MKRKYSLILDTLQNLMGFRPGHIDIAEILIRSGVATQTDKKKLANALSNRLSNDGFLNDDEINAISIFYAVDLSITSADCIELDYYPDVFGSCGTGVFVPSEQKDKISLSKDSITDYSEYAQYSVINAIGDSMTPFIEDKDKLIVKHWNGEQIKDNSVYVFRYFDEIFVKRLSKNIDQIVIKSDNPTYDTRKITASKDFQIIGQIVGLLRGL